MTSAADVAGALVANLLKSGPRNAAEILAAAEGAKISARTIQRAALTLGVVKTKEGFARGWTWRLPADEDSSKDTPTVPPASSVLKHVEVLPTVDPGRAEVIATRLRKLEAGRGKVAPIYAGDPRVLRWAQSGIGDPELREAYECAVYDLVSTKSPAPVTAGLLDRFVTRAIANTGES